jgi:hypothetical protein
MLKIELEQSARAHVIIILGLISRFCVRMNLAKPLTRYFAETFLAFPVYSKGLVKNPHIEVIYVTSQSDRAAWEQKFFSYSLILVN